jgi:signal peptidase I
MTGRRRGLISRVVTGLLLVAGFAVLSIGFAIRFADLHFQTVLSNSMRPTFSAGDVVVTRAVTTGSVRVDDVIVFQPPNQQEPVIHRVTSLRDGVVTTRGDANPIDDPWHLTLAGENQYRLVAVLPGVGWLTQLQRPVLLLAGLLVVLAIVLELGKWVRTRTRRSELHLTHGRSAGTDGPSWTTKETSG